MKHTTTRPSSLRAPHDSVILTSLLCAAGQLSAQTTASRPPANKPEKTTELPEVVIEGARDHVYKPDRVQTPKYTQPLRDIPQTITVVPQAVIQERGATSLRDVLRNVPGITMQAGEGGVPAGDNMSIRGFNARTDMFVDGIRDFGGYTRDPFNMEQVEVSKGPSSSNAGRGSTGGSVNLASKAPHLERSYLGETGMGSSGYYRATADINQPLGEHSSLRVNGVYHESMVPGRGEASEERHGIAAALGFGLGTDTRLTLSYFHMDSEGMPDYGIPWVPNTTAGVTNNFNNGLGSKINQDPGVPYDRFYGLLGRDFELTRTDIATLQFEHDFNEQVKITNTLRVGQTVRDSVITAPRFRDMNGAANVVTYDGTITRQLQSRDQTDRILAEQINLIASFETGLLKHDLVAGAEAIYESSENFARVEAGGSAPTTQLGNPNPHQLYTARVIRSGAYTDSEAISLAAYAFDTISLGDHWQVTGGLRYERFDVRYKSVATNRVATYLCRVDEMLSWRAGLVYKPVENGSIYLGYGTSFNPSAEGLTLSTTATSANNLAVAPEQSSSWELGTKWDLLQDKLQLSAALFRTNKTNSRTNDPTNPNELVVLDGQQRVQGIELGFAGSLTDDWRVFGGYTYLDSEILKSKNVNELNRPVLNTPEHSFSLWTAYDLPKGFQVGFGVQFTGERYSSNLNTAREAPGFYTLDALVGYEVNEHLSLRLNFYNLADKEYIDRVGGGHFIPGAGRSAVLTASFQF